MGNIFKNGLRESLRSLISHNEVAVANEEVEALIQNLKTFNLDENTVQILYRYSASVVNLITLTLAEGNELSLYSTSNYVGWISGGSAGVLSYALYQNFTANSYGSKSSLSVNANGYFPSSYAKILNGDANNVLYCNVDIYNSDKDTLFRKADVPHTVGEHEILITGIQHEPIYVGDKNPSFNVETMVGSGEELQGVTITYLDGEPPFSEMGKYRIQITATTVSGVSAVKDYAFTVYPDRSIDYPTDIELPPQDGQIDVVIARNGNIKYCVTVDSISSVDGFYHDGSKLVAKTDGISVNSSLYRYSDIGQCWKAVTPGTSDYYNRIDSYHSIPLKASIVYSTVDIYESSSFATVTYAKNLPTPREKYDFKTMQVAPLIECTNPRTFDSSIEGYITMRLTNTATTVYTFGFRTTDGSRNVNVSFEPTTSLKPMDNVEMCVLQWNVSSQAWSVSRKWGAVDSYGVGSSRGNLYYLIQDMDNVNIYLHSKDRGRSKLLYEVERVREAIPLYFNLNGEFVQVAGDSASYVKVFDGEHWRGVELTKQETDVKIFINGEWENIGLF